MMARWFFSIMLLVLIYTLVLGSFALWDLLLGAVLSGALLRRFRWFLFAQSALSFRETLKRLLAFMPFAGAVAWEIQQGIWDVSLRVLKLRPLGQPGLVEIPIGERTPNGVAVSALTTTLSPGAVLVDVDWERQVMIFHLIEASDPDTSRAAQQAQYRNYQRRVFP